MTNITGFLHTDGPRILDGRNQAILLLGWGLGNWLLPEGYMWRSASPRFDRPRRIEQVITELTGPAYAAQFWHTFRRNYIQKDDLLLMAGLGYNSVRIPFNARLLLTEGPGLNWNEAGFRQLDECLSWCEDAGLYAFLDLHGAPGGQTGANIDDSIDDRPRMFIDADNREKALAIWRRLAERYRDREVVGGYDLLNEPIAPPGAGNGDHDYLIPELKKFYHEAIAVIRASDRNHLLSLEGPHWATDISIFDEPYDRGGDNYLLHFHRYAEPPQRAILDRFRRRAAELNIPLWLGETGENLNEWYAALYPLCRELGIGINLWPWKKMDCTNSPCSIARPRDYELILNYAEGGPHPGFEKARQIMDEYLESIKLENCRLHPEVTRHVMRQAPFALQAVDFDEFPGAGISYRAAGGARAAGSPGPEDIHGNCPADAGGRQDVDRRVDDFDNRVAYRSDCGMTIIKEAGDFPKRFAFDSGWDHYLLVLAAGEHAEYTLSAAGRLTVRLTVKARVAGTLRMEIKGLARIEKSFYADSETLEAQFEIPETGRAVLRVTVLSGTVGLKKIIFS